jgi:hypothetical protein
MTPEQIAAMFVCPQCAGSATTLIHCACGWRSCQACPYEHPHSKPGWTRL